MGCKTWLALSLLLVQMVAAPALAADDDPYTEDYLYPESSPSAAINASLEVAGTFSDGMPRGVALSPDGRIFVCFPRHDKDTPYCVAELKGGVANPYPDAAFNTANTADPSNHFVSVMAARVDALNRLWVLDSGRVRKTLIAGGARLMAFDLASGKLIKSLSFPPDVVLPTTVLKDFRVDLQLGKEGMAMIADSSPEGKNAIIVVDIATGKSKRRLDGHYSVTAEPDYVVFSQGEMVRLRFNGDSRVDWTAGIAGLALSGDGKFLYYSPMAGQEIFSVPIARLCDFSVPGPVLENLVKSVGRKIGSSDGIESDTAGGLYITDVENNMIWHRKPDGGMEKIVRDDRLLWPDRLCLASDGYLYIVASQFNRGPWFHFGQDLREKPYQLLRIKVDAQPVRLLPQAVSPPTAAERAVGVHTKAATGRK